LIFCRILASGNDTAVSKPSKRKLEGGEDSATNTRRIELEEPLSIPEKPAVAEERGGIIEMKVITNDGTMDNLMLLTSLSFFKLSLFFTKPDLVLFVHIY
jgi:hypothetical protein